MFKALKILKNQSGVIHLIPLLLILIGIVAGVYLVQHPQIFKPKASGNIIEWQVPQPLGSDPDNCITSVNPDNNYATATCSKLKLKLNLPAQSSDVGSNMSIIKTVYADDNQQEHKFNHSPGIDYSCSDDSKMITRYWIFGLKVNESTSDCSSQTPVGQVPICVDHGGGDISCVAKPAEQSQTTPPATENQGQGGGTQVGKPANIEPKGDINITSKFDVIDFYWAGPTNAKSYRFIIDSAQEQRVNSCGSSFSKYYVCLGGPTNGKLVLHEANNGKNVAGGKLFYNGFKEEFAYTWWVDALDENGNTIGTSQGFTFTVHKTTAATVTKPDTSKSVVTPVIPGAGTGAAPANCPDKKETYGQCGGTTGLEGLDPTHVFEVTKVTDCHGKLKPFLKVDKGVSGQCKKTTPAQGGTTIICTRGQVPTGNRYLDVNQTNCLLNLRKDIVPQYVKDGWCSDDANRQDIAIDWYFKLASQAEKEQITTRCFNAPAAPAAPTTASGKIVYYRYAISYPVPSGVDWQNITTGTISIDLKNAGTGTQRIYFEFADSNKQIVQINNQPQVIAYVSFVAPGTTTPGGSATCPLDNWKNFDIPKLKELCSLTDQSKLPVQALKDFSNQDLLAIAKSVDGVNGPYQFLSQFDNNTLGSFDLEVLKKLPDSRINTLPQNLKDAISGKSTASETASCYSISMSGNSVITSLTGDVSSIKIWVASNSDIDKPVSSVGSWTLVKTLPQDKKSVGGTYPLDTAGFGKGVHAVLMSLHGSYGQMLDGNVNGVVNSKCATTLTIQ